MPKPVGFALDSAKLRRAGLDYHEYARVRVHGSWSDFVEQALKEAGRKFKSGKFQFMANARAKANFAAEGFVKLWGLPTKVWSRRQGDIGAG